MTTFISRLTGRYFAAVMILASTASAFAKQTVDLGYVNTKQDMIYKITGFEAHEDGILYAAALFDSNMMAAYGGGKIVGLRIGWTETAMAGEAEAFVRTDLNAENIVSKSCTLKYSNGTWNEVRFDTPYQIPENPENTVVGCKINAKAGFFNIATTTLGIKPKNSCWITSDFYRHENGEYEWVDFSQQYDALMIIAIIEVEHELNDRAEITSIIAPEIYTTGDTGSGIFTIANRGTNDIKKVTASYKYGGTEKSFDVDLNQAIKPSSSAKVNLPIPAFATGEMNVSISHVNGNDNGFTGSNTLSILAVPEEVAAKYTRRSLLEYYGSEGSHLNITNYEDYVVASTNDYLDRMSILCHHANDQFMTRDDEDTQMLIDLADGDKSEVYIPSMTLDRAIQFNNNFLSSNKTVAYSVLAATPYAVAVYDEALAVPTFANLNVFNFYDPETAEVTIDVNGHVEPGILPAGEKLKLTVYLLEDNVASTAPNWATAEQQEAYGGVYLHQNLIRMQPTPIWGVELDGDGDFVKQFTTEIDPEEWKFEDMHILAVLHRSEKNARLSRQVINCAEDAFDLSSINEITTDTKARPQRVFTLSGAEVIGSKNIPAGIYIVTDGTAARKILVK